MKRAKDDGFRLDRNSYLRPIGFDAHGETITQVMIEIAHQAVNERAFQQLGLSARRAA
jgi:hypothetical protein